MSNELVQQGLRRIEWAGRDMPVVRRLGEEWARSKPLEGARIAACLHVTTETANLVWALRAAGAEVALCASNPLSTQDDVAAALRSAWGVPVYARRGASTEEYYQHIRQAIRIRPHLTVDDGADLVGVLHAELSEELEEVLAGTEETTTGVLRLQAMARESRLRYPIVAVNEASTKHMFDNRYGTGQSVVDGIMRATNRLLAGCRFVVVGYGWCGRGVASRARGLGARVTVVETDPRKALEAAMDGYDVDDMAGAARKGDVFVTVTGGWRVIDWEHMELMKDGAILANAGHFDVEINLSVLREKAREVREVRPGVTGYVLPDDRTLFVLGEGRLVNLACAEGHPAQVMDMSFANQALVIEWLWRERPALEPRVHPVPAAIDRRVATLKLEAMGLRVQPLTPEQEEYLKSWETGTR